MKTIQSIPSSLSLQGEITPFSTPKQEPTTVCSILIKADETVSLWGETRLFFQHYGRHSTNPTISYLEYVTEKDRPLVQQKLREAFQQKTGFCIQHHIQKEADSPVLVQAMGIPILLEHVSPLYSVTIINLMEQSPSPIAIEQLNTVYTSTQITDTFYEYDAKTKQMLPPASTSKKTPPTVISFQYDVSTDVLQFSTSFQKLFSLPIQYTFVSQKLQKTTFIRTEDKEILSALLLHGMQQKTSAKAILHLRVAPDTYQPFLVLLHSYWQKDPELCKTLYGELLPVASNSSAPKIIKEKIVFDSVTGLLNHTSFEQSVTTSLSQNEEHRPSTMLLIRIEHLKALNDAFGTAIGETILKEIAKELKTYFRQSDIVARYQTDQFAIYLHNMTDRRILLQKLEQIIRMIHQDYANPERSERSTASIGIAWYPQDATTYSSLLRYAKKAMKKSTDLGSDRYTFYEDCKK